MTAMWLSQFLLWPLLWDEFFQTERQNVPLNPSPRKSDYHGIRDYCGERYMVTVDCSNSYQCADANATERLVFPILSVSRNQMILKDLSQGCFTKNTCAR